MGRFTLLSGTDSPVASAGSIGLRSFCPKGHEGIPNQPIRWPEVPGGFPVNEGEQHALKREWKRISGPQLINQTITVPPEVNNICPKGTAAV